LAIPINGLVIQLIQLMWLSVDKTQYCLVDGWLRVYSQYPSQKLLPNFLFTADNKYRSKRHQGSNEAAHRLLEPKIRELPAKE
jgi:hypothetical protein